MVEVELKAPSGKFRVVGVHAMDHSKDELVGDYILKREALDVAKEKNEESNRSKQHYYNVYDNNGCVCFR